MRPLELVPFLDLTTLGSTDTENAVRNLAHRAVHPVPGRPDLSCAALCIWPNFASAAAPVLRGTEVKLACVAAAFPFSQAPLAVKLAEIRNAVQHGADEIDIAINRGQLANGDLDALSNELRAMRDACGSAHLKVILETCDLADPGLILEGCRIALECGADFLKTSTGKGSHGATPEHSRILFGAARDWHALTGKMVGVKPAGGILTYQDARTYVNLAREFLAEVTPDTFRLGVSSLLDDLLSCG